MWLIDTRDTCGHGIPLMCWCEQCSDDIDRRLRENDGRTTR